MRSCLVADDPLFNGQVELSTAENALQGKCRKLYFPVVGKKDSFSRHNIYPENFRLF